MRHIISLARLPVALRGSSRKLLCRTLLLAMVLASVTSAVGDDAPRLHSLTTKVSCNCGCGDILSECSHPECKRRGPLKQEITSLMLKGKTDEEILGALENKYGATILAVPRFRGFNILLWIVPIAGGVVALTIFVWRRWSVESEGRSR
jgi:cytochrome c-type biogenesis protein CcmH/NrfF